MKSDSPYVILALGLAAVALIGYAILGKKQTVVGIPGAGSARLLPYANPGQASPEVVAGGGTTTAVPTGAAPSPQAPIDATPKATASAPSEPAAPLSFGAADLSWIYSDPLEAIRAGYGNVQRTITGDLQVTSPSGAITLRNFGTIYGSSKDAIQAGVGSIYQENGNYYVAAPGSPVKLSDRFRPDYATLDLSNYGAVQGVIRGWTLVKDRLGNLSWVPAHDVAGSTYTGSATGSAPTQAELSTLGAPQAAAA